MGKAEDVSRLDSPKAPHPALKARILLALDLLPVVPADTADVQEQVQPSTRKMPESSMADAQRGLDEIASRGEHFAGELGDLGPDPKLAGALRTELARGEAVITRLEALLRDVNARMTVLKGQAVTLLDDAHEQIVQREQRGRIQPESYAHVHRFVAARGEAITEGIVRAKALKAAQKGAANDASAVKKTG